MRAGEAKLRGCARGDISSVAGGLIWKMFSAGGDLVPHRCDAIRKGFNQKAIVLLAVRKGSIHLVCIVVAMCKGFTVICNVLDHLCLLFERVLINCHGFGGYVQGF